MSDTPKYDRAKMLLARCKARLGEDLERMSQEEVVELIKIATEMVSDAAEIRLRAGRNLGLMLKKMEEQR